MNDILMLLLVWFEQGRRAWRAHVVPLFRRGLLHVGDNAAFKVHHLLACVFLGDYGLPTTR